MTQSSDAIWQALHGVEDPEIPVINIVEMGIVRGVTISEAGVEVSITPTYSGCPAMDAIANNIVEHLRATGVEQVQVTTVYNPAWTTDWMKDEARAKLKAYGIAPPGKKTCGNKKRPWLDKPAQAACPFCDATHTELRSEFGSTACKSLHFCNSCHQPFEHFKCI